MTEGPGAGESARSNGWALRVLAVLAVLYTLYFARSFLIPIVFALLLSFLLSPLIRAAKRLRIPPPVSASVTVFALVGVMALGIYELSGPIRTWTTDAPATMASAQRRLHQLLLPLERLTRTAQQVEENITGAPGAQDQPTAVVVAAKPTVVSRLFTWTSPVAGALLEVAVLLYFLLAAGDLFLEKLIRVLPQMHDKKKAVLIARQTESAISTYLLANLAINAVEGLMVFGALYALGLPNAMVWGVMTVILEFIPYLGAIAMLALLTVTALATFDDPTRILMVPGAYMLANLIQANIVTALVLGRRLALNPVAVLLSIAFWFWIWGVPGAFLGVPLMSIFKICCDHIEGLAPIGEFLSGPDTGRSRTAGSEPLLERTLG